MTRLDWWCAVLLIVLALLIHALIPRYEVIGYGDSFVRLDRWTGLVEVPARGDEPPLIWSPIGGR